MRRCGVRLDGQRRRVTVVVNGIVLRPAKCVTILYQHAGQRAEAQQCDKTRSRFCSWRRHDRLSQEPPAIAWVVSDLGSLCHSGCGVQEQLGKHDLNHGERRIHSPREIFFGRPSPITTIAFTEHKSWRVHRPDKFGPKTGDFFCSSSGECNVGGKSRYFHHAGAGSRRLMRRCRKPMMPVSLALPLPRMSSLITPGSPVSPVVPRHRKSHGRQES